MDKIRCVVKDNPDGTQTRFLHEDDMQNVFKNAATDAANLLAQYTNLSLVIIASWEKSRGTPVDIAASATLAAAIENLKQIVGQT